MSLWALFIYFPISMCFFFLLLLSIRLQMEYEKNYNHITKKSDIKLIFIEFVLLPVAEPHCV